MYDIRGIIGKGGMDQQTIQTMKKCGAVYFLAIGGTAVTLAKHIKNIKNVYMIDRFGIPEAIWELEVENFPVIVTMDAHGKSIHENVFVVSKKNYEELVQ